LKKAVIYARVSTTKQAEEGVSIEAQIKQLQDYAVENNYEVIEKYVDRGESARTDDRPQFQQMIADIKSDPSKHDAVLIHKTDRFARSREDSIVYKSLLRKDCNCDVISIKEDFGDGAVGKMVEGILESVAEFYSENLANEVKKGMEEKINQGKVVSEPPYGYIINDNGRLKIHEPEAKVVKYIFQQYINGEGTKQICRDMKQNAETMFGEVGTTKQGSTKDMTWSTYSIKYMLKNEVYIGTYEFGNIKRENNHPGIISEEDFELVQQLLKDRNSKKTGENYGDYLLRGFIKCHECGGGLGRQVKKATLADGTRKTYHYARCRRHQDLGNCYANFHRMKFLEEQLIEFLEYVINQEQLDSLDIQTKNKSDLQKEYEQLKSKLNSFEDRFDRQIEAYQAGVIDLEQLEKHKQNLKHEKEQLQEKLNNLEEKISGDSIDKSKFLDNVENILKLLKSNNVDIQQKRNGLMQVVNKIEVSKKKELFRVHFKY